MKNLYMKDYKKISFYGAYDKQSIVFCFGKNCLFEREVDDPARRKYFNVTVYTMFSIN